MKDRMLVLGFLLLPIVVGVPTTPFFALLIPDEVITDCCILKIQGPALEGIEVIHGPTDSLDLSGVRFGRIEEPVFNNLTHVKSLNLTGTGIGVFPLYVGDLWLHLQKMEYLYLANNRIGKFPYRQFAAMKNLKFLDISGTEIRDFPGGSLYGLTKSTNISAMVSDGLSMLHTLAFDDYEDKGESSGTWNYPKWKYWAHNDRAIASIRNGTLEKLDPYEEEALVENDHRRIVHYDWGWHTVDVTTRYLKLDNLAISKFAAGWCRLKVRFFKGINLDDNEITEITSEVLNDLPENIINIDLRNNKIVRLKKGTILNEHLKYINFSNNLISEIEAGALENAKLLSIDLRKNRLNDTEFVRTLPESLQTLILRENSINELLPDTFSRFRHLELIDFAGNNISVVKSDSLRGLDSVKKLNLANNKIKNIQVGAFRNLTLLRYLDLANNELTSLEKGEFEGLHAVEHIDLSSNKIMKITRNFFHGLPETLQSLCLSFNEIETLEAGTFVKIPRSALYLNDNKIRKIENGTFDLTDLETLRLANNQLHQIIGHEFAGLDNLKYLDLSFNGITKVEKGFARHLGKVVDLGLGNNPIKRLENGALFGLTKAKQSRVRLHKIRLELLQGGVFEDL